MSENNLSVSISDLLDHSSEQYHPDRIPADKLKASAERIKKNLEKEGFTEGHYSITFADPRSFEVVRSDKTGKVLEAFKYGAKGLLPFTSRTGKPIEDKNLDAESSKELKAIKSGMVALRAVRKLAL